MKVIMSEKTLLPMSSKLKPLNKVTERGYKDCQKWLSGLGRKLQKYA